MGTTDYDRIKTKVDRLHREATKAEGALEQLVHRLQTEFGCATIEEAQHKLKQINEQIEEEETALQKLLVKFEKKWMEVLQ